MLMHLKVDVLDSLMHRNGCITSILGEMLQV